jgi:hypothetical protein
MGVVVGPGISVGAGVTVGGGFAPSATLVYDLDAANYSALPANGSTVAGTGAYSITVSNSTSRLSYSATNGGIFRFTGAGATTTDTMVGGPSWVTGQSYTVFMAYQRTAGVDGRLLNTNNETSKDWLMGLYNGNPDAYYPNFAVNLVGASPDLVWHFGWATWNTSTKLATIYIATNTLPTSTAYEVANAAGGGFDQLRMFSRASGAEVQTANIGFVKAYNGVLTLADVQGLYAQYKSRFGY